MASRARSDPTLRSQPNVSTRTAYLEASSGAKSLEPVRSPRDEGHAVTPPGEGVRQLGADSGRGSGDQRGRVAEGSGSAIALTLSTPAARCRSLIVKCPRHGPRAASSAPGQAAGSAPRCPSSPWPRRRPRSTRSRPRADRVAGRRVPPRRAARLGLLGAGLGPCHVALSAAAFNFFHLPPDRPLHDLRQPQLGGARRRSSSSRSS